MVVRSPALEVIRQTIVDTSSAFLHNVRWVPDLTCGICAGALTGYPTCYPCAHDNALDLLGFITYARDGQQSGRTMYTYKGPTPGPNFSRVNELLTYAAVAHWDCVGRHLPTGWTTVPSLNGRQGLHPLDQIAGRFMGTVSKVAVAPAVTIASPRDYHPENFKIVGHVPEHVIVFDDTWVSGGHAQSLAGALKRAGAQYVTVLCVARWLDPSRGNTAAIIDQLTQDFDPDVCPYSGQYC